MFPNPKTGLRPNPYPFPRFMSSPILYVAITNHGYGHATRTAAVVAEIKRHCPEITVILATTAPRWLLASYIQDDFIHRPRAFDVGVVQRDSLTMDKAATLERLRDVQSRAASIIASEANFLRQNRVGLVLADIPPLAAPIAKAAGVPCWMVSNFGWDFIYRAWGGEFDAIADWISDCFSQCDRLFRPPFYEAMSAFSNITDIGLIGGNPRFPLEELQAKFEFIASKDKIVMLTFGGLGLSQLPYDQLAQFPDWQFLSFDANAPDLPNLLKIDDRIYRPVDFMPLCGRIICKPGFGTFSEACRLDLPVVSLTRQEFAEAALLLDGLQDYAYHQIVDPDDFFEGDWAFLHQPMQPPRKQELIAKDGNQAIAQAIVEYFG